jgi:hypothetical protein
MSRESPRDKKTSGRDAPGKKRNADADDPEFFPSLLARKRANREDDIQKYKEFMEARNLSNADVATLMKLAERADSAFSRFNARDALKILRQDPRFMKDWPVLDVQRAEIPPEIWSRIEINITTFLAVTFPLSSSNESPKVHFVGQFLPHIVALVPGLL